MGDDIDQQQDAEERVMEKQLSKSEEKFLSVMGSCPPTNFIGIAKEMRTGQTTVKKLQDSLLRKGKIKRVGAILRVVSPEKKRIIDVIQKEEIVEEEE